MVNMDICRQKLKYSSNIMNRIHLWDGKKISVLYEAIMDAYEFYLEYYATELMNASAFNELFSLDLLLDPYFLEFMDPNLNDKIYGIDEEGYCLLKYDLNNPNRLKDIQHISKVILSCLLVD